ncbi:sensor histidine kinase [Larkinella terrae]|uniref:Sensor protein lytS n=1 Tax=Larkinella terrae TaxID=2025311 RepID=A0A7K0ECN0_9BACT|nr:histidine kinase [Larkinella terrae]MRS59713.1 sensor protein lytS [Larkinella terrae]
MRELAGIRRVEFWFAISIAAIYVIRRLLNEVRRIDDMIQQLEDKQIASATIWHDLAGYNHTLNNNFPLIAGVVLFMISWYGFHYLTFPNWNNIENDEKTRLYAGLSILLLFSSVTIYHFAKLQVQFRRDEVGELIGLKVYSVYRKRNVLADFIGFGVLILSYELLSKLAYYLHRNVRQDFRYISLLIWIPMAVFLITFALSANLPETLWRSPVREVLVFLTIPLQIYILQFFIYTSILPYIPDFRSPEFLGRLITGGLFWILLTGIVWGARSHFMYYSAGANYALAILVLFAAVITALVRRSMNKEKVQLQTQVSHTSAELAGLQSQINPHFLFNALNSLYATALKENSEKTADGIQKLGDMMRFMLHENNRDRIPLPKEVDYLRNYIELQRMRLDETHGIEIRVTIQEPNRDLYIAPMMLIPFVENAFKHGISLRNPSWIYITLTLDDSTIYFKVHNSRHATPVNDPEKERTGIGLENVKKRLELIYPGRYTLAIQASEQDFFVALTIRY